MTACTERRPQSTVLVNNSDAVWTISTTFGGSSVETLTETVRAVSFREVANRTYRNAVSIPGTSVRIEAAPSSVSWALHPSLSASWLFHEQLADVVQNRGEDQAIALLSGSSCRRRALITCAVSAYHIAGEDGRGLAGPDPANRLLAGLGVGASAAECAREWRRADDEAIARVGRSRTATWGDDVARLADDAQFLRRANRELTLLNRIGKALVHLR